MSEKLRLWGLTGEQIAEVETRGTVSDTVVVRAPAGGVVVEKNAFEGQYVSTGTRIYTIADLSHVWVKLDAYESDLPWVRPGQRVAFSTDAYPGETFEGETAFIDPVLDPRTRTAKVRVNLENPGGKLKPEMFVHGTVEAEITPAAGGRLPLVIPASAPLITGKRAVVYVETDPGVYSGREILLGPRAGDFYVVEKGLEEGERVVTQGNFKIDSAVQILARPSMMNPEGEGALAGHVEGKPQTSTGSPLEVMGGLKDQLDKVFEAYLEVHHGLSSDSLEEAQTSARSVEEALRAVNAEPLNEPARSTWMTLKAGLSEAAGTIGAAGDIAEARAAFARLSQAMYETLRRFGTGTGVQAYRFYCQMAFDGEGAYWLQTTQDAENPYYGAAMLRCSAMSEPVVSAGVGPDGEQTDD
jgi:Cu(I)/Ag(I) efflux system membrane fusion protein